MSKAFYLILRSNLSPDLLVDWPPGTVEVLGLFLVELAHDLLGAMSVMIAIKILAWL